jgi:hypothetical protein
LLQHFAAVQVEWEKAPAGFDSLFDVGVNHESNHDDRHISRLRLHARAYDDGFSSRAGKPATTVPESIKPFSKQILEVAGNYPNYGRVDDEIRWAPWLCRMPEPGKARFSESKDEDTHGRKLYSVFAKDRDNYNSQSFSKVKIEIPVGQIIVKESWMPEEVKDGKVPQVQQQRRKLPNGTEVLESFSPYASRDGKVYKASKMAGLYIMMKTDPKTPDTDQGWIYGTVSADLKQVTSIGKVESCMECHTKAPHDRLFGLTNRFAPAK